MNEASSRRAYILRTSPDKEAYVRSLSSLYNSGLSEHSVSRFKHQHATAAVLGPNTPYRGLVAHHELGTGKTMTSVRVVESSGRRTWVITKASLSAKRDLDAAYTAYKNTGASAATINRHYTRLTKAFYMSDVLKVVDGTWVGDKRIGALVANREYPTSVARRECIGKLHALFRFVHYNGGLSMLKDILRDVPSESSNDTTIHKMFRVLRGEAPNPFDHTTVVVDECHNISEGILNTLETQKSGIHWSSPPANAAALYALLTRAVDCKIVLLTATPVVNDSYSAALLCNMAVGHTRVIVVKAIRGRGRGSLLKRLVAALPDAWKNGGDGCPVAVQTDHTQGTRLLVHIAPFGTRFVSCTEPHRVVPYYPESADHTSLERVARWNRIRKTVRAACTSTGLQVLRDEFQPTPFPSPIGVHPRTGALSFSGGAVEEYHRLFDPAGRQSTAFIQGALGVISRYQVPDDMVGDWAQIYYHKGEGTLTPVKNISYVTCRMHPAQENHYDTVVGKYRANTLVTVPATQAALATSDLVQALETGKTVGRKRLEKRSAKYSRLLAVLDPTSRARDGVGNKTLIFCSLRKKGGVETIARLLQSRGMTEVRYSPSTGTSAVTGKFTYHTWVKNSPQSAVTDQSDTHPAMRFAVYKGDMDKSIRNKIINAYREYDMMSASKTSSTSPAFSILLMTTAGAEGLNTRSVQEVHVMDPFWHNVRLKQVVGRARRADSHSHWPDGVERRVDVYVYVAKRSVQNDSKRTSDEEMWRVAMLKLGISNWVDSHGLKPGSVELWSSPSTPAIQQNLMTTLLAHRSVMRFSSGESLRELMRMEGAFVRNANEYMHSLQSAARAASSTAAMCANGGVRCGFDGLREISALPRLFHGDLGTAPRFDAAPWILPIIDNRVRTYYDGPVQRDLYGYVIGDKYGQFDPSKRRFDKVVKETRRVFQRLQWPDEDVDTAADQGGATKSSSDASTGTSALLSELFSKTAVSPVANDNTSATSGLSWAQQVDAGGPLRMLFEARKRRTRAHASDGRQVTLSHPARTVVLDQTNKQLPVTAEHDKKTQTGSKWLPLLYDPNSPFAPFETRCVLWNAFGEHRRGPRTDLSPEGLRRTSHFVQGCMRCGSNVMNKSTLRVDSVEACTGKNKYEPVRECADRALLEDLYPMIQEPLEFPPSLHGISPDITGDTVGLVNFLTLPDTNRPSSGSIRRFTDSMRASWFEIGSPLLSSSAAQPDHSPLLMMMSVAKQIVDSTLDSASPWRRLLPDTTGVTDSMSRILRMATHVLTQRPSRRRPIWQATEELLRVYRTAVHALHPKNRLRRLVHDIDAALIHASDTWVDKTSARSVVGRKPKVVVVPAEKRHTLGYGHIPAFLPPEVLAAEHKGSRTTHDDRAPVPTVALPLPAVNESTVSDNEQTRSIWLRRIARASSKISHPDGRPPRWPTVVRWARHTATKNDSFPMDTDTGKHMYDVLVFVYLLAPFSSRKQSSVGGVDDTARRMFRELLTGLSKYVDTAQGTGFVDEQSRSAMDTASELADIHPLWGNGSASVGNPYGGAAGDARARARRQKLLAIARGRDAYTQRPSRICRAIARSTDTPRTIAVTAGVVNERATHPGIAAVRPFKVKPIFRTAPVDSEHLPRTLAIDHPLGMLAPQTDNCSSLRFQSFKTTEPIGLASELSEHVDYIWQQFWKSQGRRVAPDEGTPSADGPGDYDAESADEEGPDEEEYASGDERDIDDSN